MLIFYQHTVNPNTNSLSENNNSKPEYNTGLDQAAQIDTSPTNSTKSHTRIYEEQHNIVYTILLLCGDIEINPGPRNKTRNPCGLCDRPVTWSCEGICCDDCSTWHHRSCIELCSHDYELLQRSHVQWMCCKCDSMNVNSFTYKSFELYITNITTTIIHR